MAFNLRVKILAIFLNFIPGVLSASKVKTGSGRISRFIIVPGKVIVNPNKTAHVSPRYDGVVTKVNYREGDTIQMGAVLATIEQNNIVSRYNIISPISGVILYRYINPGEFVSQDQMGFQISDVKTVWIDFEVRPLNIGLFKKGRKITIKSRVRTKETVGELLYISPVVNGETRTIPVSVEISNTGGIWVPGMNVEGYYFDKIVNVPHVIPVSHLQEDGGKNFVFVENGNSIRKAFVRIGQRDDHFAEVLAGISFGSTLLDRLPEESHSSMEENGHDDGEHTEHKH